jgi:hypothetical protein
VIEMPKDLTAEQRQVVDELSKVMDGNPREALLRDAKSPGAAA